MLIFHPCYRGVFSPDNYFNKFALGRLSQDADKGEIGEADRPDGFSEPKRLRERE